MGADALCGSGGTGPPAAVVGDGLDRRPAPCARALISAGLMVVAALLGRGAVCFFLTAVYVAVQPQLDGGEPRCRLDQAQPAVAGVGDVTIEHVGCPPLAKPAAPAGAGR
ncbi:MAG: hypothetical protein WAS73_11750 [Defluviicoccus sp.]